jgi:hypothetical protein
MVTTPAATTVAAGKQPRTANMARGQTAVDTVATVIAAPMEAAAGGTLAPTPAVAAVDIPAAVLATPVAVAVVVVPAVAAADTRAVAVVATLGVGAAATLQAADTVRVVRVTKHSPLQPKHERRVVSAALFLAAPSA